VLKARASIRDDRPDGVQRKLPKAARAALAVGAGLGRATGVGQVAWDVTARRVRDKACRDLKDFICFYNLIQDTASRVSGDAKPRYLAVNRVYKPNPKDPWLTRREREHAELHADDPPYYQLLYRLRPP
jgi:hypothetical protein